MTHEQGTKLKEAEHVLYSQVYKVVEAISKNLTDGESSREDTDEIEELQALTNMIAEVLDVIQFCNEEYTND